MEVYNSCQEWFIHDWGTILNLVMWDKVYNSFTEICHCNNWGTILYPVLCLEVYSSLYFPVMTEVQFCTLFCLRKFVIPLNNSSLFCCVIMRNLQLSYLSSTYHLWLRNNLYLVLCENIFHTAIRQHFMTGTILYPVLFEKVVIPLNNSPLF